ncbi:alkaline phosphatase D family protein [Gordonia sp. HY002]|uniref:alkaline phosphatase D family protein n=1 Tax=Gordonia zhenghanii TaxID=2911516 RepID=UPI001EF0FE5B|nr:alkaline phosphatase D family protein [Gordonia zhenghanii]MCF8571857.1 alkaline phosphatase D family protein [Gordonia zhenghanii]MCF8604430.1 alkaline phosphatase D family protein [Gordonia zhenghanii]
MSEAKSPLTFTRRGFIGAAGAGALAVGLPLAVGPADAARSAFRHGVASGDPLPGGVILWTRVTPTATATPGSGRGGASDVTWEVAGSRSFGAVIASGTTTTDASRDHTVKVDVSGLRPATVYWYRFRVTSGPAAGSVSPVGRTKTAPAAGSDVARARFGVVSCSNWEAGYFSSYGFLADRTDLDAVIHLGDYIYEYGPSGYAGKNGVVRRHEPSHDIVSLADYRIRHGQYKTDPDLQAVHRQHPFIVTWDDHEAANDQWSGGAENHKPSQGSWAQRKARADRAYFEWMPVRPQVSGDNRHIYRRLAYGKLLELSMLDLRTYRDVSAGQFSRESEDPGRTITGRRQMEWVKNSITTSDATWQIVGNSVMISPLLIPPLDPARTKIITDLVGIPENGIPFNGDQWDGYVADRRRLLDAIDDAGRKNVVFITGDIHMSWANDIPRKPANYPGAGTVATEFVVTSVTSNNLDDMVKAPEHTVGGAASAAIMATNHHTRWVDTDEHGYGVLTVTPAAARMDWYFVDRLTDRRTGQRLAQSWTVKNQSRRMTRS